MSFCPLPSIMMITAIIAACLSIGGVRFAIWAAGAVCAGMVFVGSFMGFHVDTSASITTTILSVLGTFSFTSIFGYYSHVQTRRWLTAKKELAAQNERIQEQYAVTESALQSALEANEAAQAGEPGQERVPGEHEPRAPHSPERDPRLQRDARRGRRGLGRRRPPCRPQEDPDGGPAPARPDQRRPRSLQDRGREDAPVPRDLRAVGRRRGGRRDRAAPHREEGQPTRGALPRRHREHPRGRDQGAPGAAQPPLERREVHRGRSRHARRAARDRPGRQLGASSASPTPGSA